MAAGSRAGAQGQGAPTSEVEAANVVDARVLDQGPDLGLLQVVDVVVVGGPEISAQASVMAGDDDAAAARLLLGVDAVLDTQAGGLDGVVQDGRVLVVTGASKVDDAVGGQHVLGAAGRVLSGAAGDELGVVVVEEILVQGNVLVLGEDGVIGLEAVLVQQGLVADGLDVCNGRGPVVSDGGLSCSGAGRSHSVQGHTEQRVLQT